MKSKQIQKKCGKIGVPEFNLHPVFRIRNTFVFSISVPSLVLPLFFKILKICSFATVTTQQLPP